MGRKKLLVANRGEIACRIFQACRELGIDAVALSAPGDEASRHLTFADEILEVPSYLDIDAIVETAVKAKIDLIHPGYGFLSERAQFVDAVEKAKMVFVGPTGETMRKLGSKIDSKKLADEKKVPTAPWALLEGTGDAKALKTAAQKIGFPLLIKASAGGGGKGMRKVHNATELDEAASLASSEAKSSFGDGSIFLEKCIEEARHVEVQMFGDGRGQGVHFYERECSLQRRHQKVWEESPAPKLPAKTKSGLFESALKLVQATKYRSAGTVEFLVDSKGDFYFLEVNTRLQVEHPVTEEVTRQDLVHRQIELALDPAGFKLDQATITQRGHAIEIRIYAEDPSQGFMPSPGRIQMLRWPSGAGIRVESGIEEGQEVGTSFDPMCAKLIVWGETRTHALERLKFALDQTVILGIGHNLSYLRFLATHPMVLESTATTKTLETISYAMNLPEAERELLASAVSKFGAASGATSEKTNGVSPWSFPWR